MGDLGKYWNEHRDYLRSFKKKNCLYCDRVIAANNNSALDNMPDACRECKPDAWITKWPEDLGCPMTPKPAPTKAVALQCITHGAVELVWMDDCPSCRIESLTAENEKLSRENRESRGLLRKSLKGIQWGLGHDEIGLHGKCDCFPHRLLRCIAAALKPPKPANEAKL